jgi:hypothetical protein
VKNKDNILIQSMVIQWLQMHKQKKLFNKKLNRLKLTKLKIQVKNNKIKERN